jgi:hypothetical protein
MLLKQMNRSFRRGIKTKHIHPLCRSGVLTIDELIDIFGVKRLPKSDRRLYKETHPNHVEDIYSPKSYSPKNNSNRGGRGGRGRGRGK